MNVGCPRIRRSRQWTAGESSPRFMYSPSVSQLETQPDGQRKQRITMLAQRAHDDKFDESSVTINVLGVELFSSDCKGHANN